MDGQVVSKSENLEEIPGKVDWVKMGPFFERMPRVRPLARFWLVGAMSWGMAVIIVLLAFLVIHGFYGIEGVDEAEAATEHSLGEQLAMLLMFLFFVLPIPLMVAFSLLIAGKITTQLSPVCENIPPPARMLVFFLIPGFNLYWLYRVITRIASEQKKLNVIFPYTYPAPGRLVILLFLVSVYILIALFIFSTNLSGVAGVVFALIGIAFFTSYLYFSALNHFVEDMALLKETQKLIINLPPDSK